MFVLLPVFCTAHIIDLRSQNSFALQLEVCTFWPPSPIFAYRLPPTSDNHQSLLCIYKLFCLFCIFFRSAYKWNNMVFVFEKWFFIIALFVYIYVYMYVYTSVFHKYGRPGFDPWVGNISQRRERLLPYSDLENSMVCIVHGVAKSWTQLSEFNFKVHKYIHIFVWTYVYNLHIFVKYMHIYEYTYSHRDKDLYPDLSNVYTLWIQVLGHNYALWLFTPRLWLASLCLWHCPLKGMTFLSW